MTTLAKLHNIRAQARSEGYRGQELDRVIADRTFEISQNPGDWALIAKYTGEDIGLD